MPNLVGQTEAAALARLTALKLNNSIVYVDLEPTNANVGKVISQGTKAGTLVTPGTEIVLTVGRTTTAPS
jgi:beta-lactam-binding protein with PASTA domain